MTCSRLVWLLTCLVPLLVLPASLAIGPPPTEPDDGGSGSDAPDRPPSGVALPIGQLVSGGFDAADRWDWYSVDPGDAAVLHVELHAATGCLVARVDGGAQWRSCASPVRPASAWVPVAGADRVEVGLERGVPESYEVAVGADGFAPRPQRTVRAWEDDAGSGRDAPDVPTDLVLLSAGRHQGTAAAQAGDRFDWFRLAAAPGETVHVRVDPLGPACVHLVAGEEVDPLAPCGLPLQETTYDFVEQVPPSGLYLRLGGLATPYQISLEIEGAA